jgi:hypothetical protein
MALAPILSAFAPPMNGKRAVTRVVDLIGALTGCLSDAASDGGNRRRIGQSMP